MSKLIKFLIPGLFAGLMSCEYNEPANPVDSKIIVEVREMLEGSSRKITLSAKTEKIYLCMNYSILATTMLAGNKFEITYTGIFAPGICLTALGPATSNIDLGSLSNGVYLIELNNSDLINKGILTVTDTEIKLSFEQLKGIDISRVVLKRVPAHTYWGAIGYHTESSIDLVEQFIRELEHKGAAFDKQLPGDYWYYQIDQDGEIIAPEHHGYHFARTIIFRYSGDETELRELIETGGGIDKEDLSIKITTYKGARINNWSH